MFAHLFLWQQNHSAKGLHIIHNVVSTSCVAAQQQTGRCEIGSDICWPLVRKDLWQCRRQS